LPDKSPGGRFFHDLFFHKHQVNSENRVTGNLISWGLLLLKKTPKLHLYFDQIEVAAEAFFVAISFTKVALVETSLVRG
jgi:hypothetical protein